MITKLQHSCTLVSEAGLVGTFVKSVALTLIGGCRRIASRYKVKCRL